MLFDLTGDRNKINQIEQKKYFWIHFLSLGRLEGESEAGVTFDNSFFDNYFDFLRQLKNGSFLGPVFVHVTGQSKN